MNGTFLAMGAALAMSVSLAGAQDAPTTQPSAPPAVVEPAKKATPDKIYDEAADAQGQIDAALTSAKKNNRRVLVQWGANWCGWCHLLHGTFTTDKEVKKKLRYEYDLVLVDVGRFDKNMELAKKYGADLKAHGLPFLTVLDADGRPVANQETGALEAKGEGARGHDGAKVLAFLSDHQAAYPKAESVLGKGVALAAREHKRVFLHFGAPWCIWCHRLEDWMARPDVAAILAKDFVDVKIDLDRTVEAEPVMKRFREAPGGIPWFCVLGEDGKVISTSDGPSGNIGFPGEPPEVEHFVGMMNKARKSMTPSDVQSLRATLETDSKKEAGHG